MYGEPTDNLEGQRIRLEMGPDPTVPGSRAELRTGNSTWGLW